MKRNKDVIDLGLIQVKKREAADCVKMLMNDARELAGQFHGENRSEKFRLNWPDEYKFADANWKSFVQDTITAYATLMGHEHVPEEDKRRMYIARIVWEHASQEGEKDTRLQLFRNTQQFVGDPFENRKILRDFGKVPNLRAAFKNATMLRH